MTEPYFDPCTYWTYIKPDNMPLYINRKSNQPPRFPPPPTIIKKMPKPIAKWNSDIFSSEVAFNESIQIYSNTLSRRGFHDNRTLSQKPLIPRQSQA